MTNAPNEPVSAEALAKAVREALVASLDQSR